MDFYFTLPIEAEDDAERKRLVGELEMRAVVEFADPRDKEDYGISLIYMRDLNIRGSDDWFIVHPQSATYHCAVEWLKRHQATCERLEQEWNDYCAEERLVTRPLVHEHTTY